MSVENPEARRALHQRFVDDMHEVGIRAVTVYLERKGIVPLIQEQLERIQNGEGMTSTEYFRQKRIQRKLAAAASR